MHFMVQKMVLGNAIAEQNYAFNVGSAASKLSRGMMEYRQFGTVVGRRGASGGAGTLATSISGSRPPMGYEFMNRQITYHQFNAMK